MTGCDHSYILTTIHHVHCLFWKKSMLTALHKFIRFQKQSNMVRKSDNEDLDGNVIRFFPVLLQTET